MSRRRRQSLRTNWKNGQPVESLENRVVPAAVAVSFASGTLTLVSTAGNTNEVVSVKAGATFTDVLVGGKLTTRLSGTDFDDITTIIFNADGGSGDSLSVTGITSNSLTITLTGVEKLQLNTGDSLTDTVTVTSTGSPTTTGLTLVTSNVNGNLSLTHNGTVNQSGKLIVSGDARIVADSNGVGTAGGEQNITLKTSGNSFGAISLFGNDIALNELGSTNLNTTAATLTGATTAAGSLTVTSTGVISGTGMSVGTTTTLTSNGANITVSGDFTGSLLLKGTTVTVTDNAGDTDLGKTTAISDLSVTSTSGEITNSGSVSVGGLATFVANGGDMDITLTTGSNNFGSLSLTGSAVNVTEKSATDLRFVNAISLKITSSGAITDSGMVDVGPGLTDLSAKNNSITLDTPTNVFRDTIVATGTNILLIDNDGDTTLGNVTAKGDLTVTSQNGNVGVTQAAGATLTVSGRITIDANDTNNTPAGTNVNDIILNNTDNKFGSISVDGDNVTLRETDASNLFTSTAASNFQLISGGAVTDTGVVTVGGTTTIQAGPAAAGATSKSITLDDVSNSFSSTINLIGANALLINTDSSALGDIDLTSGLTLTSTGAVTQATATSISIGGRLTIDADDNITLDASAGETDNFGSLSLTTTGNATIVEDSSTDLFTSDIDGNFDLTTTEAVTDSGDVDVDGTTDIDASTTVTLNSTGSDYVGAVSLDGTSIFFFNNTDTVLAEVTIQGGGSGTLTIISDGGITDAGTGNIESGTGLVTFNAADDISITGVTGANQNDFNASVSLFGDTVTFTTGATTGDLNLATSTIREGLSLTVAGALTQTGTVKVTDDATINTGTNNITLTNASNEFGRLVLTSAAVVDIVESGNTDLGTSSVTSLKITSTGDIEDSGTLTVAGLAELIAGSGSLTLDSDASNFGSLKLSIRDDIAVTEAAGTGGTAGTALAGVTTQGDFTLTAAGAVTESAGTTVVVLGDVTINAAGQDITLNRIGNIFGDQATDGITFTGANVTLFEINPTVLSPNLAAPSTATGTLTIRSTGSITAAGVVTAGGATTLIAGDTDLDGTSNNPEVISLANAGNAFGTLTLQGGVVTIHDSTSGTTLGASTVSSLTLTSVGGNVTQTGNLSVTDLLSITANNGAGNVNLANETQTNILNRISITGNNVSIDDTNAGNTSGTVIDFLDVNGDFSLDTTGNVTASSKDITIDGNTNITATGSVNLDPVFGNDVNVTAGGSVTLDAVGNLVLGDITAGGNLMITATGNVTNDTTDNGFGTLEVNGNVTVAAGGTVFIDVLNSMSNITGSLTGATTTVTPAASTITISAVTGDDVVNIADGAGPFTISGTIAGGNEGFDYDITLLINGTTYSTTVNRVAGASTAYSISGVTLTDLVNDADLTINASVSNADDFGAFTPADGTATRTYVADIVAPTLTITPDSSTVSVSTLPAAVIFTFQFSEIVTGFVAGDITIAEDETGGTGSFTVGAFTAVDGDTYTLVVTINADSQVGYKITADVAAGVANDAAGNGNTAATQAVVTVVSGVV
jgi:hypothetical protein